jgi:hypothetical protein
MVRTILPPIEFCWWPNTCSTRARTRDRIVLAFANGAHVEADIVIGADGVRSVDGKQVGEQAAVRTHHCRHRFCRPAKRGGCCRGRQYSSASMIVITRSVTDGSVGSGEWYVSVLSK